MPTNDATPPETDPPAAFIRPDVETFLARINAVPGPTIAEIGVEAARAGYVAMQQVAELPRRELAVIRDLSCPGPAGDIPLRLYDGQETRHAGPALVFFHGGGFVLGDLESHDSLCSEIAAVLDLPVIAVHYRLAPEHPFPAAPDDAEAAARWIASSPVVLDRTITGLVTCGDSAGGNLAIVTAQALSNQPAAVPVIAQIPIYPVTDDKPDHPSALAFAEGYFLSAEGAVWFGRAYRSPRGHPRAFPIYGDLSRTPPTLLITAALDPIRDSGRLYAAELVRAGVEVHFMEMKGTIHGFAQFRKALPSAQDDVQSALAAARLIIQRLQSTSAS